MENSELKPVRLNAWIPKLLMKNATSEAKRRGLTLTALVIIGLEREIHEVVDLTSQAEQKAS